MGVYNRNDRIVQVSTLRRRRTADHTRDCQHGVDEGKVLYLTRNLSLHRQFEPLDHKDTDLSYYIIIMLRDLNRDLNRHADIGVPLE